MDCHNTTHGFFAQQVKKGRYAALPISTRVYHASGESPICDIHLHWRLGDWRQSWACSGLNKLWVSTVSASIRNHHGPDSLYAPINWVPCKGCQKCRIYLVHLIRHVITTSDECIPLSWSLAHVSIAGHERTDVSTRMSLDLDDVTAMETSYGDLVGWARDHYNDKEQSMWTNGPSILKKFNEG